MKHHDLEAFERNLRASLERMVPDPDRHTDGSVVLHRNREVTIELAMMLARERNRGTSEQVIIEAAGTAIVELVGNQLLQAPRMVRIAWANQLLADIHGGLVHYIDGNTGGFDNGTPADMAVVEGGHA